MNLSQTNKELLLRMEPPTHTEMLIRLYDEELPCPVPSYAAYFVGATHKAMERMKDKSLITGPFKEDYEEKIGYRYWLTDQGICARMAAAQELWQQDIQDDDLIVGSTYRAKKPKQVTLFGKIDDRQIIWRNSTTIQFDGPGVKFGQYHPKVHVVKFLLWVGSDVTDVLEPGEWATINDLEAA